MPLTTSIVTKAVALHSLFLLPRGSSDGGVNVDPSQGGGLPGGATLTSLADGVGHWALIASVVGVVIGGVMWAFGHFSHNYQQSYQGRKGVLVSGLAALLIGGANTIVGFFFTQGQNLH
jgi:type IV secretory pathway VirB2 component (pilin)